MTKTDPGQKEATWMAPRDLGELYDFAPEMVPSLARKTLLELQQGVFHAGDQLSEFIQHVYCSMGERETLQKFRLEDYTETPEHGFIRFMETCIVNLGKNWVQMRINREAFLPTIAQGEGDETQPGSISERRLDPSDSLDPLREAMKAEDTIKYDLLTSDFIGFLEGYMGEKDCVSYQMAIRLLYDEHSWQEVGEILQLSLDEVSLLKSELKKLMRIFQRKNL